VLVERRGDIERGRDPGGVESLCCSGISGKKKGRPRRGFLRDLFRPNQKLEEQKESKVTVSHSGGRAEWATRTEQRVEKEGSPYTIDINMFRSREKEERVELAGSRSMTNPARYIPSSTTERKKTKGGDRASVLASL